ncbi:MAG: Zn-ribbon domain-containing OB-fold protein [Euryarchaeota archaeon]|nr:Zn-ribbon domain-containing OB-fold protein [Euryarchaeota archaeon]
MTTARFWRDNATRYNLIATKCGNCGKVTFPPRNVCPVCHRKSMGKMEKIHLSGHGEVYSFSVVYDAPLAFEMQKPYVIAIIKMAEGVMLTAQIIDCECCEVAIGMKVKATLRKIGEEGPGGVIHYGYKFVPA